MGRRPRVVFVLDWFAYYAAAIAEALSATADVMVVTRPHGYELGLGESGAQEKLGMFATACSVVMVHGRQSSPFTMVDMLNARRAIKAFGPDIIHCQVNSDWRLYGASALRGVPRVVTVHDVVPHPGDEGNGNSLQRFIRTRLLRRADAVIVHGEALQRQANDAPWHSAGQLVRVIPHGALSQPTGTSVLPDAPCLLFFGRIEYYKGLDVLIKAVEIAAEKVDGLRLVIAGRGPEVERCMALVTKPELFEWRIGFVADEDVPGLFAECSAVCLPYREASQSGVVPLAFANCRSVIASRVGGIPEAVDDGCTGYLVAPEDPAALGECIVRLFASRERLQRMSDAACEEVTSGRLSPQSIAREHVALYSELIGRS